MFSFRDLIVFLAGFEFFHTLMHFVFSFIITFPMITKHGNISQTMNFWAIVINGLITILLLLWARQLRIKGEK